MLTPEDKAWRLGRITSSRVAAVLGFSPYQTPLQAWLEITGRADGDKSNKNTKRGDTLENITLDEPVREMGLTRRPAERVSLPGLEWAGDSMDTIYQQDGIDRFGGEGKTAGRNEAIKYGKEGTDQVPDYVNIQSHWHLIHHQQFSRCLVPVLVGGDEFVFRIYHVDRDESLERDLLAQAKRFYDEYVATDRPPPVTDGDLGPIKKIHPKSNLLECTESLEEIDLWARRRQKADAAIKQATKLRDEAEANLRWILGPYEMVKLEWSTLFCKNSNVSLKTDHELVVAETVRRLQAGEILTADVLRQIIDERTSESHSHRTLSIRPKKEKAP